MALTDVNDGNRDETRRDVGRKLATVRLPASREDITMRKTFLLAAVLTVAGSMLHSALACELNPEANRPRSVVVSDCGGSGCTFNPPQDPLVPLANERTAPDPLQDCDAAYFDPDTYSGSNGLIDWLIATLGAESQYRLGAGFAPSPMDANAQYR